MDSMKTLEIESAKRAACFRNGPSFSISTAPNSNSAFCLSSSRCFFIDFGPVRVRVAWNKCLHELLDGFEIVDCVSKIVKKTKTTCYIDRPWHLSIDRLSRLPEFLDIVLGRFNGRKIRNHNLFTVNSSAASISCNSLTAFPGISSLNHTVTVDDMSAAPNRSFVLAARSLIPFT